VVGSDTDRCGVPCRRQIKSPHARRPFGRIVETRNCQETCNCWIVLSKIDREFHDDRLARFCADAVPRPSLPQYQPHRNTFFHHRSSVLVKGLYSGDSQALGSATLHVCLPPRSKAVCRGNSRTPSTTLRTPTPKHGKSVACRLYFGCQPC
jgi:hypothetical protein